jgi:hypothetical protein
MDRYTCSYHKCTEPIVDGEVVVELDAPNPRYWHGRPKNCDERQIFETGKAIRFTLKPFSAFESWVRNREQELQTSKTARQTSG